MDEFVFPLPLVLKCMANIPQLRTSDTLKKFQIIEKSLATAKAFLFELKADLHFAGCAETWK